MKKIKLFLAAIAAMVGLGVNAQEDITSQYLTNADLNSKDGWTITGEIPGTLDTSMDVNAIEFYHSWSANAGAAIGNSKSFRFSQTINLPAGDYRIAVNAFYREGNGNGTNTKAYIFAGTNEKYIHAVTAAEQSDLSNGNGKYKDSKVKNDMGRAAYAFSIGDFEEAFDFTVEEAGEIEIGFNGYIDTYCSWCIFGPMKLFKYSLEDYLHDYDTKYAEADAISGKMNNDVQAALTAAMVDRNTLTTSAQVATAIAILTSAITNANYSIAYYSSLKSYMDAVDAKTTLFDSYGTNAYNTAAADAKAAYNNGTATDGTAEKTAIDAAYKAGVLATKQPGNGMDMTAYIQNPDFSGTDDGWTKETPVAGNCGLKDNVAMEYWAGNATDRKNASFNIYQELDKLPAGAYTISADMYNSLNGEGGDYTVFSPTCGVYGSSSNEEVALVTEEGTTLKTYTTGEVLVFRGKMTIGTKNTITPMAARWFLFDNVKLTYARQLTDEEIAANRVPESISLNKQNVTLTIYGTETLEATVLPEDANDKSVTWTSSDKSVATVSNGVVTAVGVGNAIITVSANGADNLTATAEITVNDVTPVAAPAFYSEIAAGDFYIVNAATGKYLGGANNWGTHASLIEHAIPITVALSDDKYTFDTHISNGGDSHYFGGEWMDGGKTSLYITSVGNGKYSISTGNSSAFVTAHVGNTLVANDGVNASSTLAQWYFLSKKDFDKMLAAATAENPVDATYYIKDANFGRNYTLKGWTGSFTRGGNNDNMNAMVQNAVANVYQTLENIPNGTYTLKVQAVTSGAAKFYANDVEQDIESKDDVTDQATASNAFGAGFFKRELSVTVTDRTLKIGVKSDDTDKTLYFDNFELFMTGYTANTGVDATIDKDEFEKGQTAQITAATVPATASFNALTYTSSDETVATVDENGVVTGVAAGTATITVAAGEMEDVDAKVIEVTVTLTPATDEDYALLNGNLAKYVLGFDAGEFAPYNNPDLVQAIAVAKAIDQTAVNTQESVQTAANAITGAAVIANEEEVNAVYNGDFAATENNAAPAGWRSTKNNAFSGQYMPRVFNNDDRLTEFNATKSAFFIRFDGTNSDRGTLYYYGDTENYIMPLKASTTYYVKADVKGWGSTGKPQRMNIGGPEGFSGKYKEVTLSNRADNDDAAPQQLLIVFTTTTAGNYTISFQCPGNDDNKHNAVVSNIELKRATAAMMKITDAKYATFVAPFDVTIPDDVEVYTVDGVSGSALTLSPVSTTIPAKTPVVLFKDEELDETTFYGYPVGDPENGLLVGTYTETTAPNNGSSFVLQNGDEGIGFYKVVTDDIKVPANRAYLNYSEGDDVKAFFFGGGEDAIKSVFDGVAAGEIYDLSGRKVAKMQKGGAYIVNGKKVIVK